ncbi:MAG: nicotinamide riboside transporter PnuC [Steroidobacteraceae bacterium]
MTGEFLASTWLDLQGMGPAAWLAVITGVIYIIAIMRRRRIGWIFSAISAGILAVLAARSRLPMQALLQSFYVLAAIYGWRSWSGSAQRKPVTTWHWRGHALAVAGCLLLAAGLSLLLAGESDFPFVDSLVACMGLTATWMTARVYLENWLYWFVVDVISLYLFLSQGLAGVALLYVFYLGIAGVGFLAWWKSWRGGLRGL